VSYLDRAILVQTIQEATILGLTVAPMRHAHLIAVRNLFLVGSVFVIAFLSARLNLTEESMKNSFWLLLTALSIFFSCGISDEELNYGEATRIAISEVKQKYGFQEVKIVRPTRPKYLSHIVIECEDGKNIPVEHLTLNRLMNSIAGTILTSLDNELKIEFVHVNFTTNFKDRSIFEPQSRTTSMSFRMIDGKLIDVP